MKYTVNEFIEMTKQNPNEWISYCEILILDNGMIELARPSHMEKVIEIYCEKNNITREEFKDNFSRMLNPLDFICEKYHIIAVWYNKILMPKKINRFQRLTINKLQDAGLISAYPFISYAIEYSFYKKNKEFRELISGGIIV